MNEFYFDKKTVGKGKFDSLNFFKFIFKFLLKDKFNYNILRY